MNNNLVQALGTPPESANDAIADVEVACCCAAHSWHLPAAVPNAPCTPVHSSCLDFVSLCAASCAGGLRPPPGVSLAAAAAVCRLLLLTSAPVVPWCCTPQWPAAAALARPHKRTTRGIDGTHAMTRSHVQQCGGSCGKHGKAEHLAPVFCGGFLLTGALDARILYNAHVFGCVNV